MHTKSVACLMLAALVAAGAGCAPEDSGGSPGSGSMTATASATTDVPVTTSPGRSDAKPTITSVRDSGRHSGLSYDVLVPQIYGGNAEAADDFNLGMRGLLEDFIAQFAETRSITDTAGSSSVVHLGEHVVSGILWVSVDFGGVHPMSALATHVTNLDTGREITLGAAFTSESEGLRVLSEQARLLLPQTRVAQAGAPIDYDGITPTAEHFSHWAATPEGLRVYFEQGQVAPPVAGDIDITVPWSALAGSLAPGMREVLAS